MGCNSVRIVKIMGGMGVRIVDIYFMDSMEIKSMVKIVEN
jgi:hypothetical protein